MLTIYLVICLWHLQMCRHVTERQSLDRLLKFSLFFFIPRWNVEIIIQHRINVNWHETVMVHGHGLKKAQITSIVTYWMSKLWVVGRLFFNRVLYTWSKWNFHIFSCARRARLSLSFCHIKCITHRNMKYLCTKWSKSTYIIEQVWMNHWR